MRNTSNLLSRTINNVQEKIENSPKSEYEYDLIIVGAGPGGIMTAFKYANLNPDKNVLILEQGKNDFESYKELDYDNVYNWFKATNDSKYLYNLSSINDINLILGQGCGGGTKVFGLQYIDQEDLINEYDSSLKDHFTTLNEILRPSGYSYDSDNELLNDSWRDLYKNLNDATQFNTYNNKVYSKNLTTGSRLLYCELLNNLQNVDIVYDVNIKDFITENNSVIELRDFKNKKYIAENYALCAGAIQNPGILQRSGIKSGNNLKDHSAVNFVFVKESKNEIININSVFNEEDVEGLDSFNVSQGGDFDLSLEKWNNDSSMFVIFRFTKKFTKSEVENMKQGKRVNVNLQRGSGGYPYVFDMGKFWLGGFGKHPGGSLKKYIKSRNYDFTNLLLGKHGDNFPSRVLSRPGVKLVGVKVDLEKKIEKSIATDLKFNSSNTLNHIQTRATDFSWQTYLSFIPPSPELMILTCATSKYIGNGKITLDENDNSLLNIDLGYKNINHDYKPIDIILNAYNENYEILKKMGYININPNKIDEKFIEDNLGSIYHYHGTCAENVDENNRVKGLNNLYIGDISIATKSWLGSSSTLSAVYGLKCGENIQLPNITFAKFGLKNSYYQFVKSNNNFGFNIQYIENGKKKNLFYDFEKINKNEFKIKKSFPDNSLEGLIIELSEEKIYIVNNKKRSSFNKLN